MEKRLKADVAAPPRQPPAAGRGRVHVADVPPAPDARTRILRAGLRVFAAHGFEGATMQEIADEASVKQPLIVYHFKSKRKLWNAVVEGCSAGIIERTAEMAAMQGSATDKLRHLIGIWIETALENPEYHRILTLEGHTYNDRLQWIFDRHLGSDFSYFCSLVRAAQAEGGVRAVDPELLRYALIGAVSLPSISAEYKLLTGRDPTHPKEVKKLIEAIDQLIFVDPPIKTAARSPARKSLKAVG